MEYLFLGLAVLSFLALAAGMIRPSLVVRWGARKTRTRAAAVYGLAGAAFLLLFFVVRGVCPSGRGFLPGTGTGTPADSLAAPAGFSRLEIGEVSWTGTAVLITGTTDLPDDSRLVVDFDVASPDSESDTVVSEDAIVKDGRFSVEIDPPDTPAFARGPFWITVLFSPRTQPPAVLDRVGGNGENLYGTQSSDVFGFRILQATRNLDLRIPPR